MDPDDRRSWEASFPDLYRAGYRAALRVSGDATSAEDAASEATVRAGLRWRRVHDHARPWVIRVAVNLAIDELRRQARQRGVAPAAPPALGRLLDAVPGHVDLYRALGRLPTRQREVVVLRYFGDLSEREIADELGLAPGTVKSHASRGLAALRADLDGPEDARATTDQPREKLS